MKYITVWLHVVYWLDSGNDIVALAHTCRDFYKVVSCVSPSLLPPLYVRVFAECSTPLFRLFPQKIYVADPANNLEGGIFVVQDPVLSIDFSSYDRHSSDKRMMFTPQLYNVFRELVTYAPMEVIRNLVANDYSQFYQSICLVYETNKVPLRALELRYVPWLMMQPPPSLLRKLTLWQSQVNFLNDLPETLEELNITKPTNVGCPFEISAKNLKVLKLSACAIQLTPELEFLEYFSMQDVLFSIRNTSFDLSNIHTMSCSSTSCSSSTFNKLQGRPNAVIGPYTTGLTRWSMENYLLN